MNMNKALQNLYHAVSGSTTTKVNISKLLVDIHYAITGVESSVKNNWSRIIDSMATNWPEGGGVTIEALSVTENDIYTAPEGKAYSPVTVNVSGGSSDFSTATVTIVNNLSSTLDTIYMPYAMAADAEQGSPDISMPVFLGGVPVGTSSYNAILYKGSCYLDYASYQRLDASITGSATKLFDGAIVITGDCTIAFDTH